MGTMALCVRGRFGFQFIDSKARLTHPLVRAETGLTETPWIDALDLAAGRLSYVKSKYGAQAIAGLITARCTNEDLYVFQKFMRGVIGTNHIDSSARYGHVNFVRAVHPCIGHQPHDEYVGRHHKGQSHSSWSDRISPRPIRWPACG